MPALMYMLEADQLPGRMLHLSGREYLYCSGTSYLGIARNPAFTELVAAGFHHYGTNYGSSRRGSLQLRVYAEAEAYLAAYTGAEAALTVSSGYLAGQLTVAALAAAGRFEYAPGTHPAAWLPAHPAPPALPYEQWATQLLERLHSEAPTPVVIITNSLDPLRVARYDFRWTQHLPTNRPITLLIDDSHGLGVIGREGAGIISEVAVPAGVQLVVVSSLGKAMGVPGGVVLGPRAFINQLQQSAVFGASSPIVPAYLAAFLQAAPLYAEARQRLAARMQQFAAAVAPLGLFQSAAGFPVFYTPYNALYAFLEAHNVLISSFPYPTPTDPYITRVVLSALHSAQDVQRVATLCREFVGE